MTNGTATAAETQVITEGDQEFLTWGETTEIKTKRLYIDKYRKWIEYLDRVPLDEMVKIQARYLGGGRKDMAGYMIAVLKYVMITPKVTSDNVLMKADSGLLLTIVGDVVNQKEADDMRDGLGED